MNQLQPILILALALTLAHALALNLALALALALVPALTPILALALAQVYGDAEMHADVRRQCMNFMAADRAHFSQFVAEDFDAYVARKRRDGVHGNNPEIQAMAELYCRPVQVYSAETAAGGGGGVVGGAVGSEGGALIGSGGEAAEGAAPAQPLNIFHGGYDQSGDGGSVPIRLSYHNGNHYNALTDPTRRRWAW